MLKLNLGLPHIIASQKFLNRMFQDLLGSLEEPLLISADHIVCPGACGLSL